MSLVKTFIVHNILNNVLKKRYSNSGVLGDLGSGAGKGGGGGGTVREAGGSMGKYGAVKEEEYFYKKQREQLGDLSKAKRKKKQACGSKKVMKVEDVIHKNRKRIAKLEKCFRKK